MRGGSVLLLMLVLMVVSSAEWTECPDHEEPKYDLELSQTPAGQVYSSAGSLKPLYNFAQLFLKAVQPHGLPLDVASRALRNEAAGSEVMVYEAGYVVCLILAVLYMVIMLTVGAVLAWRYFHCKNTRSNSQSAASSSSWYLSNITVIPCLFIVVIILLSGVILAFSSNNKLRQNIRPSLSDLLNNFQDIEEALSSVPQKVDLTVDQFSTFQTELMSELYESGDLIGKTVLEFLDSEIKMASSDLKITVQDATGALHNLQTMQTMRVNMQSIYSYLQDELQMMRTRLYNLDKTLNTSGLQTDADYSLIPNVDTMVQQLSYVSEFNGMEKQFQTSVHSVPQICTNQTTPQIKGLLPYLYETEGILRNHSRRLPSLKSLSDAASSVLDWLHKSEEQMNYYEYIRWSLSVFFCTLILVIVLLMLAGLVTGASVVISPRLYPFYLQDRVRLTAVYLLCVAAAIIFVFSWLIIIMVFINLFFGGNAHALACRGYTKGELFEFLDKQQYLFSSLYNDTDPVNASSYQKLNVNSDLPRRLNVNSDLPRRLNVNSDLPRSGQLDIKTPQIYEGCKEGRSLFYSMYMNQTFNMDGFLNASLYMSGFNESLKNLTVSLDNVKLTYTTAVQRFRDSSQLELINYNEFRALLARPIMLTDLNAFAINLDMLAAQTSDFTLKTSLWNEAGKARQLAILVHTQASHRSIMNSSMEAVANISQHYKANANNTLQSADDVERSIRYLVPYVAQNVSECMMDRGSVLLEQYLDMVKFKIIEETLNCSWLPVSLNNMYVSACENLIGPWNGFWLSLGWCCIFLIPGVIFSILAARLWCPSSSTNKELFHMPDDIIDKDKTNPSMNMEDTSKSKMKPPQKTEGNIYQSLDELKDFKKDEDSTQKKSFNVYMSLDEVMGYADGEEEEKGGMKNDYNT